MDADLLKEKWNIPTTLDVLSPRIRFISWGNRLVKKWDYPKVYQSCWILHYNLSEGLLLNVAEKNFSPGPDKVYLFPPFTRFSGYMEKPFYQFFAHFHILEPARNVKHEMITLDADYMKALLEDLSRHLSDYEMRSLVLHNIVQTSFARIPPDFFLPENKNPMDPRIHRIISMIERTPNEDYRVNELAKMAKMSEKHFHRCFVAAAGINPKEFIQQKRLEFARDLLSQTDKSIEEIAESASFANRYHFSRAFKKYYHFSPCSYKKKFGLKPSRNQMEKK